MHTKETRIKISKNKNIVTNYKDGRANYSSVHKWLVRWYGKARKCDNRESQILPFCCNGKSKTFDWANMEKEYSKNRDSFIRLCRSCHTKKDKTCFQKGHKYYRKTEDRLKDKDAS